MLILVCGVLAVLSPAVFGGDLRRLANVRLRMVWLPLTALVAQIVIIEIVPDGSHVVLEAVHVATYVAAGVFVAVNWRVPGLLVIAAGGALNGLTIALNGGTLPASVHALRSAGFAVNDANFTNSGVLAHPVLPIFGDIFAWPDPLPLSNVFSFGDVLIVAGAAYGAHRIAGSRLVRHPWSPEGALVPVSATAGQVSSRQGPAGGTGAGDSQGVGFAQAGSLSPLQRRLAALRPEPSDQH